MPKFRTGDGAAFLISAGIGLLIKTLNFYYFPGEAPTQEEIWEILKSRPLRKILISKFSAFI